MNSYIITPDGLSLSVNGKTYDVDGTHPNFDILRDRVRKSEWDDIETLIDMTAVVTAYLASVELGYGEIYVDGASHQVLYQGSPINNTITDHLFTMLESRHDVMPIVKFLHNLMQNPSKKAIDELYGWMSKNGMSITDDGHLLAYKRVRDDYMSFFDGKFLNNVGTEVSMPRWQVDDRSERTCSAGLHFCSQSYLPHYMGGQGRVLLLKINPADVVSIPTDYNHAKGRACKYTIVSELHDSTRERVETEDVLTQAVVTDVDSINTSPEYQTGYQTGYKAGRGKQRNAYPEKMTDIHPSEVDFASGYRVGYADGRKKRAKQF